MIKYATIITFILSFSLKAQEYFGVVQESRFNQKVPFSVVKLETKSGKVFIAKADEFGRFYFDGVPENNFAITIKSANYSVLDTSFSNRTTSNLGTLMLQNTKALKPVDIFVSSPFESDMMRTIEGMTITHAKKTQIINIEKLSANKAINNAREIYGRIPGLTIWESDGGGLQLGIGARGLNPSRSAHINIRQNGYDIAADPLGYPESYYTPPVQSLKAIHFIRGAASLQFGPQFGGMLNFVTKDPSKEKIAYKGEHTYGAYNLFATYNELSGTLGKRFSYFGYGLYKRGDGWRDNSGFKQFYGFGSLKFAINEKMSVSLEQTHMNYLAQQAGGLTDALFDQDPRQSIRDRNWFKVNWNISALNWQWHPSIKTRLSFRVQGVKAGREALGNLDKITRIDDLKERTLIAGNFNNINAELRSIHKYPIKSKISGVLSAGVRYYRGFTTTEQGLASDGFDAGFEFLNPTNLEFSSYQFPSQNIAGFAENIFSISKKISISIGARIENINTAVEGNYRTRIFHPLTEELLFDSTIFENSFQNRNIFLFGGGITYKLNFAELYGNVAQNYRAINFSDIRVSNPNQRVDENIQDEKGFTADLGLRKKSKSLVFDLGTFFIYYNNKIGVLNTVDTNFETIRLRTNIGLAYSTGVEMFAEKRISFNDSINHGISIFGNFTFIHAKYVRQEETAFSNKSIEQVPPLTIRGGIKYEYKKFSWSLSSSYVHQHFSDATNAIFDPNAVAGIIPSYYVADFSGSIEMSKLFALKYGLNNFTNNKYFTRRAVGYPGPGIIPSDGISFYLTLSFSI